MTDAAKHTAQARADLATARPFLRPGSLVVLADHLQGPVLREHSGGNQVLWLFKCLPQHLTLIGLSVDGNAFYAVKQVPSADELGCAGPVSPAECKAAVGGASAALRALCAGAREDTQPACDEMLRGLRAAPCDGAPKPLKRQRAH